LLEVNHPGGEFRRNFVPPFTHERGQLGGPFRDSPAEVRKFAQRQRQP